MSAYAHHRSSSFRAEARRCRGEGQRPDRSDFAPAAVLLRERIRFLRDLSSTRLAGAADAERLKGMDSIVSPETLQSLRMRGPRGLRRTPGLAGWQQLVLVAYMEKHIAQSMSIRALSRLVYLSCDGFRRGFKRSFGMPPRRYLNRQRIERAKTLLAQSAESITAIGLGLGFSQASSFSAAFRRVTGISPTEYRQIQR